jgi:2-C-methyl-D-erythritol 2,4-cyclodiphosphate synthase
MMKTVRVGHGYDIHRLVPGRRLILGGVTIDFPLGLEGHSDADVVCHAIMDALLGASALGDIGQYFPNTDLAYSNANSISLLERIGTLVSESGYCIGNIDVTVIAENPRLAPYIERMKQNLSRALKVSLGDISIKATTNENIGLIGMGEGIAAFSVALLFQ